MAIHNDFGAEAEELTVAWLTERGYQVIDRNWKYGNLEIDIIAKKEEFLHFIEVKALKNARIGHPEDAVTKGKFKKLQRAVHEYIHLYPASNWIQYDVMAISFRDGEEPEFFFIEDVFLK